MHEKQLFADDFDDGGGGDGGRRLGIDGLQLHTHAQMMSVEDGLPGEDFARDEFVVVVGRGEKRMAQRLHPKGERIVVGDDARGRPILEAVGHAPADGMQERRGVKEPKGGRGGGEEGRGRGGGRVLSFVFGVASVAFVAQTQSAADVVEDFDEPNGFGIEEVLALENHAGLNEIDVRGAIAPFEDVGGGVRLAVDARFHRILPHFRLSLRKSRQFGREEEFAVLTAPADRMQLTVFQLLPKP